MIQGLTVAETAHWWTDPFKCILIVMTGWMGISIDIEPARLFLWMWAIDWISFSVKELVVYRRVPITTILLRSLMHISILIIPFIVVLLAHNYGENYQILHNMVAFMCSVYLAITSLSNIATMFTKKEYKNDKIIGLAIEGGRAKLIVFFKKWTQ